MATARKTFNRNSDSDADRIHGTADAGFRNAAFALASPGADLQAFTISAAGESAPQPAAAFLAPAPAQAASPSLSPSLQANVTPAESGITPTLATNDTLTATQTTVLVPGAGTDLDGDGVIDPGDTVVTTVVITNNSINPGALDATGIQFSEILDGMTQTGSINVSPVAFGESFTAVGNTLLEVGNATAQTGPQSSAAGSVIANDVEFFGDTFTISAFDAASAQGGIVTMITSGVDAGSFTYVSDAGYTGIDTFTYTIRDDGLDGIAGNADDLTSIGKVTITVTDQVWYITAGAAGTNEGTSANPFNSIASFNAAAVDGANDYIYIQGNNTGALTLEVSEQLIGTGNDLIVGAVTLETSTGTNTMIDNGTTGITLATNNTIKGVTVNGTANGAIGIQDGGGTVGSLVIDNVSLSGSGKAVDIDQGGTLNVDIDSLSSASSASEGVHLQGVSGSFNAAGGHIQTSTGQGFLIGDGTVAGVDNSGGTATISYGGDISSSTGTNIEVRDRAAGSGTVTFSGTITDGNIAAGGRGLYLDDNVGGTISFTGQTFLSAGGSTGAGVVITDNSAAVSFAPTGTGLDITTAGGTGLLASNNSGTLTITGSANSLTSTTGTLVNILNSLVGAGGINLGALSASGTVAGDAVVINNLDNNAVTIASLSLASGATGDGIDISNSNAAYTFTGAVNIVNGTAGARGVILDNNDGGTVTFSGGGNGLDITTTTGAGFTAINGGTVNVAGSGNTIASGSGTALNVANTDIGASDLNFVSIAANGGVNGIVLNNTGAVGGLTVTGTGSAGSGGTIQNTTGVGILLTSTRDIVLDRMIVQGADDDGIRGTSVNGFTLNNSSVLNNGLAVGHRGIEMIDLMGSGGMNATTVSGSAEGNVRIENNNATLTAFNVVNSTISNTNMTFGDDGMLVLLNGSGSMTASVTGSTFTDNRGDHFQAATDADATGPMNITFNNNTLSTTAGNDPSVLGGGITINTSGSTDIVFQINNNNIQQAFDDTININLDPGSLAGASMNGTINGNTIGTSGVAGSGSESSHTVTVQAKGQGVVDIDIMNNNLFEWGNEYGILLQTSEGSADIFAKVTGNTLHVQTFTILHIDGIHLNAGATAGDNGYVELVITGNDVTGEGNAGAGAEDIRLRQRFLTTVELPGYVGANTNTAAVNAFVAANNDPAGATPAPTVSSIQNVGGGGGGFIGGTAVPSPIRPEAPPVSEDAAASPPAAEVAATPPSAPAEAAQPAPVEAAQPALTETAPTVPSAPAETAGSAAPAPQIPVTPNPNAGGTVSVGPADSNTGIFNLPAGQQVVIQWRSTIDPQTNQLIDNPSNQGTISATNAGTFPDVFTDDPSVGGASDPTVTALDALILGGTVWDDNGAGGGTAGNGLKEGTEPGVDGVSVTLFADTGNTAGVWDALDTQIGLSQQTTGGGDYNFTGLAPGEYIVRIDADNFDAGGNVSLLNRSSTAGSPDPDTGDPDIDNDDNGALIGAAVYSGAITLAYNSEPTAGMGNDTNTTLDFGFVTPNQPPQQTDLQGDTATWTEGDSAVLLDDSSAPELAATITDPDSGNFGGGSLIVTISVGAFPSEEGLFIESIGNITSNPLTAFSGTVSFMNTEFATYSGGNFAGGNITFTFDDDATPAAVQALVRAMSYNNNGGDDPTAGARIVSWTLNDGDGNANGGNPLLLISSTVNVVAVNDAPALADATVVMAAQSEDDPAPVGAVGTLVSSLVDLDTLAGGLDNVTDPDSASIGIAVIATNETDGTLHYSIDGGANWQLVGAVTSASALLLGPNDRLYFQPDAGFDGTIGDAITLRAWDASAGTAGALADTTTNGGASAFSTATDTASLTVSPDNLAPALSVTDTLGYSENDPATVIAPATTLTDSDSADFDTGSVTASFGGTGTPDDQLAIRNEGNGAGQIGVSGANISYGPNAIGTFVGGVNGADLVITLSGSFATPAAVEALLRNITYANISDDPVTVARTVTFTVTDGDGGSSTDAAQVNVTASADLGVANDDAFTITEAGTITGQNLFDPHGSGADSDPDSPLAIATVNGGATGAIPLASGALLTVNSDGSFDYDPNGAFDETPTSGSGAINQPAVETFTYTLSDGDSATVTITINGLDTDDDLIGTAGVDTLTGGGGNDRYFVTAGDAVVEAAAGGSDTVIADVSYTLSAGQEIELLRTYGSATTVAVDLTGNGLDNAIAGNNAANTIDGKAGADVMYGYGADDRYFVDNVGDIVGEAASGGSDTVITKTSYTLAPGQEVELLRTYGSATTVAVDLTGNEFANTIVGNSVANIINGKAGADVMWGYGGNDTYFVDHAGDTVTEAVGGGSDTIIANVSYTLAADQEVELLRTLGSATTVAVDFTGNEFANAIAGNAAINQLDGKSGADVLYGYGGADNFAFTTALGGGNVDFIGDFEVGIDEILLENAVFTSLAAGALGAGAFRTGAAAADADDRIIYNSATGALLFDVDGFGGTAAVQFATLSPGLGLAASDFTVI